mgnify:CR=1 FL=1
MDWELEEENSGIKLTAKVERTGEMTNIEKAKKEDGPFRCSYSNEELIIRRCIDKRDHFAYKSKLSSVYPSKETKLHFDCKTEICESLAKAFPDGNWEVERHLKGHDNFGRSILRPDISGRINIDPVVIEIQASTLTLDIILNRIEGYSKFNQKPYLIWIVPLKEHVGEEKFRPRLFEQYLHSMYYGRIYYWVKGMGSKVLPTHFAPAERWIKETMWYNEFGDEEYAGGYSKRYKNIFLPEYGSEVDLKKFKPHNRPEFTPKNEKKAIPSCRIYQDNLHKWWKTNNKEH